MYTILHEYEKFFTHFKIMFGKSWKLFLLNCICFFFKNVPREYYFQVTFLHRVVYTGEHNCTKEEPIVDCFQETVKNANAVYHHEKVSGFLLLYAKYFIHIIEVIIIITTRVIICCHFQRVILTKILHTPRHIRHVYLLLFKVHSLLKFFHYVK